MTDLNAPGFVNGREDQEQIARHYRGFVYVIRNPVSPGLHKVGYSMRDPVIRAQRMKNEGHPLPLEVVYWAFATAPKSLEARVHEMLEAHRLAKEWFSVDLSRAIQAIRAAAGSELVFDWVISGMPGPPQRFNVMCPRCHLSQVTVETVGEQARGTCATCGKEVAVTREYAEKYATRVAPPENA